jgi:hypothetical protein
MTVPNATMIAAARTELEKLLTSTCTHKVRSESQSNSGAVTNTWSAGTSKPCLVYSRNTPENGYLGDTRTDVATHVIRMKHDAGISVGDKLVIGSDEFSVIADGDSDSNRFLLEVLAVRVRPTK